MSRKDYVAIAAALRSALAAGAEERSIAEAARRIADAMAVGNPRFDRARFLAACGVSA